MTAILGISGFYHDSAAALVVDGEIVAAAQEERFTRRKHDARFPESAMAYCLEEAGLQVGDLDFVAFYEKPLVKFDRLIETYVAYAPAGLRSFSKAMPLWLEDKLRIGRTFRHVFGKQSNARFVYIDHHESHAASAFFPSPFEEAAILTLDGVGEWTTASCGTGSGNTLRLTRHLEFPHSLGLLYSAFTYYCGFRVNSGEYKLMGLAPFGSPSYAGLIRERLIDLKEDGSFRLDMQYFNYCEGLTMTSRRFDRLFGGPPRRPEAPLEQRHMDLAASIQQVTEDIVLRMGVSLHRSTGMRNLTLAGGVSLNCVANGRLLREGPFDSIWVQPAAGDAGGALGSALFVWHQLLERPRRVGASDSQSGSFLGPRFGDAEIRAALEAEGIAFDHIPDEAALLDCTAGLLDAGNVVGWFQGRMEFGPRALGARSILGDPRSIAMQSTMNLKIKFRESFRPFAPCVLQEHAHEWFGLEPGEESPYMLLVAPVLDRHRLPVPRESAQIQANDPDLRLRINVARSTIPAVTHIDHSARVQTIDESRNPRFHRLLRAFHERTGCPVLVNTSFNVRGEPIVCTPRDAIRCFMATDMDALVLGDFVVRKADVGAGSDAAAREQYLAQFQLD